MRLLAGSTCVAGQRGFACGARAANFRARRQRFKCRKRSQLATGTVLFGVVHHFLLEGWSPSQIAGLHKLMRPDEAQRSVTRETISNRI